MEVRGLSYFDKKGRGVLISPARRTEKRSALPALARRNTLRAGQRVLLLRHVRRRSSPRSVRRGEVKKLGHVRHGLITRGEAGQIEAGLNQLKRRREVHGSMGDEVLLRKRRH